MPIVQYNPVMLTDADLLQRLTNVEDATVERKVASDLRDVVKAAVAFSNSLPAGDPGIIYYGVRNNGEPEGIADNGIESHLKKLSGELSNIYPPILPQLLARKTADGLNFIAVVVSGSENRPHFAGKSYLRDGTRTVDASGDHVNILIDRRGSKTNEILKSIGRRVTAVYLQVEDVRRYGPIRATKVPLLDYCNQFFVILRHDDENPIRIESIPLRRVEISHDNERGCLLLEIYPS
jgi:predicted HTH transcriptional regulator